MSPLVRRAAIILPFVLVGCKSNQDTPVAPPPADLGAFGSLADDDAVDFAPYLAEARAIITHATVPPAPAPPLPAQRVIVTLWAPPADAVVATALGADLYASVREASESLSKAAPPAFRIQIDVVKSVEPATLEESMREKAAVLGLSGFATVMGEIV